MTERTKKPFFDVEGKKLDKREPSSALMSHAIAHLN